MKIEAEETTKTCRISEIESGDTFFRNGKFFIKNRAPTPELYGFKATELHTGEMNIWTEDIFITPFPLKCVLDKEARG